MATVLRKVLRADFIDSSPKVKFRLECGHWHIESDDKKLGRTRIKCPQCSEATGL